MTAAAAPVFLVKRIKYAVYRIGIVTSLAAAEAERALAGPMPVEKRGKSGVRTLDIRPLIRDCAVAQTGDGLALDATVDASGESYLNPSYIAAFLDSAAEDVRVLRRRFLLADGGAFC